jgi:histidinol dehydrogenase
VTAAVSAILADVRRNGDEAALAYTERFDGVRPQSLRVTEAEIDAAARAVDPALLSTFRMARRTSSASTSGIKRTGFMDAQSEGLVVGQRVLPLASVGLYVPGGTARYPSTVLMAAIPAKIAGVKRIVMTTPPDADGNVPAVILAAAKIAGVTDIVKLGGAQAVAALAYGTQSVPRVDKIVGPGNIYVATAKQLCFAQGLVAIDMVAGPSEILVIADEQSNPAFVAADLLSQAEHDRRAAAWLVTPSAALAQAVRSEVEKQLSALSREAIARESVEQNGRIFVVPDLASAANVANAVAPEHLEICTDAPFALLPLSPNAGSVVLGRYCPEPLGDYLAGPNHTLPTSGTARVLLAPGRGRLYQAFQLPLLYPRGASKSRRGRGALRAKRGPHRPRQRRRRTAGGRPMSDFLLPRLQTLDHYTPGEQPQDRRYVKLNTNESPFPPSPRVLDALSRKAIEQLNLYPDPLSRKLREAIAAEYGLTAEKCSLATVRTRCRLAFKAYADETRGATISDVSTASYRVYAQLYRVDPDIVPLNEDYRCLLENFGAEAAGGPRQSQRPHVAGVPHADVERIVAAIRAASCRSTRLRGLRRRSLRTVAATYPNLLVVRTYSSPVVAAGGWASRLRPPRSWTT